MHSGQRPAGGVVRFQRKQRKMSFTMWSSLRTRKSVETQWSARSIIIAIGTDSTWGFRNHQAIPWSLGFRPTFYPKASPVNALQTDPSSTVESICQMTKARRKKYPNKISINIHLCPIFSRNKSIQDIHYLLPNSYPLYILYFTSSSTKDIHSRYLFRYPTMLSNWYPVISMVIQ